MTAPRSSLPNIAEIIGPVLRRLPAEQRPLVIAAAERLAANRYRAWADQVMQAEWKAGLHACADREDDIATRVEAMFANAKALQQELLKKTPELTEAGSSLFSALSLRDQFALQAQGERVGAATWRSYAAGASETTMKEQFLRCAVLEEESAAYLESLIVKIP